MSGTLKVSIVPRPKLDPKEALKSVR